VRLIIQIKAVRNQFVQIDFRRPLETAVSTTAVAFASAPVTSAGTRTAIAARPTIATTLPVAALAIAFPRTATRITAATLPFRTRTSLLLAALAHGLGFSRFHLLFSICHCLRLCF
jgi:hypothetical protein